MPNMSASRKHNIVLFSGHMIDAPGRKRPRFPPGMEPIARRAIAQTLSRLRVREGNLAISGGACGGDLLFAEEALARGAGSALYLPLDQGTFLSESVDFAGGDWHARFLVVAARSTRHVAPVELGPLPEGEDAFERNNLWMLREALGHGPDNVDFVCLWNGEEGDGPGGTRHMMEEVRGRGGRVHWLDTRTLWTD